MFWPVHPHPPHHDGGQEEDGGDAPAAPSQRDQVSLGSASAHCFEMLCSAVRFLTFLTLLPRPSVCQRRGGHGPAGGLLPPGGERHVHPDGPAGHRAGPIESDGDVLSSKQRVFKHTSVPTLPPPLPLLNLWLPLLHVPPVPSRFLCSPSEMLLLGSLNSLKLGPKMDFHADLWGERVGYFVCFADKPLPPLFFFFFFKQSRENDRTVSGRYDCIKCENVAEITTGLWTHLGGGCVVLLFFLSFPVWFQVLLSCVGKSLCIVEENMDQ